MTDHRVYIVDKDGYEIEAHTDLRDDDGNMVGVYMEGPGMGEEIALTESQELLALSYV